MSITFNDDGTMTIEDPVLEANLAAICAVTGESPAEALHTALKESAARYEARRKTPSTSTE